MLSISEVVMRIIYLLKNIFQLWRAGSIQTAGCSTQTGFDVFLQICSVI